MSWLIQNGEQEEIVSNSRNIMQDSESERMPFQTGLSTLGTCKLPDEVVLAKTVNMFKNGVDIALSKDTCKYSYGLGSKWLQEMVKKDSASSDALI